MMNIATTFHFSASEQRRVDAGRVLGHVERGDEVAARPAFAQLARSARLAGEQAQAGLARERAERQ